MRQYKLLFTGEEYHFRLGIFLSQARYVKEFNGQQHSFKVGLNAFSTYTRSEYKAMLGFKKGTDHVNTIQKTKTNKAAPDSIDWRDAGIVNPIKDQGQCGSCWAFSAIQVVESFYANTQGTLYSLAEAQLVDCVLTCFGCDGGNSDWALFWVRTFQSGKFNLEADYPYVPKGGLCKFKKSTAVASAGKTVKVKANSEDDLKDKVGTVGVASIAIDASHNSFQAYQSGIYNEPACSSSSLDHAVGAIGYGTEDGVDYWLVRNSWGVDWGINGYIKMSRNKKNQCGVAAEGFVLE